MSVDYAITNVGAGSALDVRIISSGATRGVSLASVLPVPVGDIAVAASTPLTITYGVPAGAAVGRWAGTQGRPVGGVAGLRERGRTGLVVEQNAHGALRISDTGIVMELGRVFMSGPAAEVIADPRSRVAYLGGEPG